MLPHLAATSTRSVDRSREQFRSVGDPSNRMLPLRLCELPTPHGRQARVSQTTITLPHALQACDRYEASTPSSTIRSLRHPTEALQDPQGHLQEATRVDSHSLAVHLSKVAMQSPRDSPSRAVRDRPQVGPASRSPCSGNAKMFYEGKPVRHRLIRH